MTLTKRALKFIDRYMAHGNATKAMRESGFNGKRPDQAAYENLRKPEIKQEIERRTALLMGAPEVVRRFAERSRATIADVIHVHEIKPAPTTEGEQPPDQPAEQPEQQARRTVLGDHYWTLDLIKAQETGGIHQIKKLKEGKYGVEIELYDPLPALEVLAKYLKLFGDESAGILKYLDLSKLTKEQLQRLADGDDPIAVLLATNTDPGSGGAGAA